MRSQVKMQQVEQIPSSSPSSSLPNGACAAGQSGGQLVSSQQQQQQQQQQQSLHVVSSSSYQQHQTQPSPVLFSLVQQHPTVTSHVSNGHPSHQHHQPHQHHGDHGQQHQQQHHSQQQHGGHAHSPLLLPGGTGGSGGSLFGNSETAFALSSHTDDENDVFLCGKCKCTFAKLHVFLDHKKHCNSSGSMHQHQLGQGHSIKLESSASPSHLHHQHQHQQHLQQQLDLELNHLMLSGQGDPGGPLLSAESTGGHLHHHSHHQQQQQQHSLHSHHHHQHHLHHHNSHRSSSPTLAEAIGGHSVNSILSETDLLSLTPSLDAQMMVSIGNSISPSSILHLQGGDMSANTDDFEQFRLTPTLAQSPPLSTSSGGGGRNQQHMEAPSLGFHHGLHQSSVELHHHGHQNQHQPQQQQQQQHCDTSSSLSHHGLGVNQQTGDCTDPSHSLVNSLMSSLQNSTPAELTSFASLIENLSAGPVLVAGGGGGTSVSSGSASNSLMAVGDVLDANSNDASIGSPSRFLNLPLPPPQTPGGSQSQSSQSTLLSSSDPSTPLRPSSLPSIVEHHPYQHQSSPLSNQQQPKTVIHHHPSHLSPVKKHTAPSLGPQGRHQGELGEDLKNLPSISTSSSQIVPPNVTISERDFEQHKPPLVKAPPVLGTDGCGASSGSIAIKSRPVAPGGKTPQKVRQRKASSQGRVPVLAVSVSCNYCDRSFTKPADLQAHMPCHTGERPFQCLHCGKAFLAKSNLRKHIQTHKISSEEMRTVYKNSLDAMPHATIAPSVQQSDKTGDTSTSTQQQIKTEIPETPMETSSVVGGATLTTSQGNSETIKIENTGEEEFKLTQNTSQCQTTTSSSSQHLQLESAPSVSSDHCLVTSESSPPSSSLSPPTELPSIPKVEVNPQTPLENSCPLLDCSAPCSSEAAVRSHFIDCHLKVPLGPDGSKQLNNLIFKCVIVGCDELLFNIDIFIKHLRGHRVTADEEREKTVAAAAAALAASSNENQNPKDKRTLYRCTTCLNRYTTEEALQTHEATSTHHYPCSQCDKVFPCDRYLRRHVATHGAIQYNCKYCDKSFKTANYLKVHLVIHTGEKPFTCSICEAAFNRRDKLKRHELVHDPVKRFKCPLSINGCTREFNRPDKLKAHIQTHTGVKPYQCTLCERSFTRRAHLREHFKLHEALDEIPPDFSGDLAVSDKSKRSKAARAAFAARSKSSGAAGSKSSSTKEGVSESGDYSASKALSILAAEKDGDPKHTLTRTRTISSSDEINPTTEEEEEEDEDMEDSSDDALLLESSTVRSFTSTAPTPSTSTISSRASATVSAITSIATSSEGQIIIMNDRTVPDAATLASTTRSVPSAATVQEVLPVQTNVMNPSPIVPTRALSVGENQEATDTASRPAPPPPTLSLYGVEGVDFLSSGNYVLVFSCPACDQCFLKETELKAHKCCVVNGAVTSSAVNSNLNVSNNPVDEPKVGVTGEAVHSSASLLLVSSAQATCTAPSGQATATISQV